MKSIFLVLLLASSSAWATSSTRTVSADNVQNTTGGASLAVPATGTTLSSDTNTQTLQNKTISGASNTISNLAASSISSGQLGVANGGTGLASVTSNGIPYGQGTSALAVTSAGSQYQTLQAGAAGVPQFGAVALNQSAAVSGQLGVANGGTGASTLASGAIVLGNGTSAVSTLSGTVSGQVATWNGSAWAAATPSAFSPVLNASQASPQSVTAAGGISLSGLAYVNVVFVKGNAGAVTVTATPSITNCTAAGQILYIFGEDGTNTVTLQDNSGLAGSNLLLNGNVTLGLNSMISLMCDGNTKWVEFARQ